MICNRCHHSNPEDAVHCHNCGHDLNFAFEEAPTQLRFPAFDDTKLKEQKPTPQSNDKLMKWIVALTACACALLAMITILVVALNETKESNDPPSTYQLNSVSEAEEDEPEYESGIHKYIYPYYLDSSKTE